jgi:hypothetical protein
MVTDIEAMTLYQWLQVAQSLVMALAVLFVWSLRAGVKSGRWLSAGDAQTARVTELERRMNDAGDQMSKLATFLQALPERMRQENERAYQSKLLSEERWAEIRGTVTLLSEHMRKIELDRMVALEVQQRQLEAEVKRVTEIRARDR